jgi:hypothetical protein
MIKPITKEYFKKLSGDTKEYIKRHIAITAIDVEHFVKETKEKTFPFASTDTYLYFEKPGEGVFVYISSLGLAIIPKVFESISIDKNEEIDFSDWELERLSETPNKVYTINNLSYTSGYHDYLYSCQELMDKLSEGDFMITNKRIGFSTEITLKKVGYWRKELLLGYSEKLKMPYNMPKLRKLDKSLKNMLIWTQSKH